VTKRTFSSASATISYQYHLSVTLTGVSITAVKNKDKRQCIRSMSSRGDATILANSALGIAISSKYTVQVGHLLQIPVAKCESWER